MIRIKHICLIYSSLNNWMIDCVYGRIIKDLVQPGSHRHWNALQECLHTLWKSFFVVATHNITQNLPIGNRSGEEINLLLDWFQVRPMHHVVCTKEGLWIPPHFKMCTENGKENTKRPCALLFSLPYTPLRKIPKFRCYEGGIQAGNRRFLICQLFNLLLFGTTTCSASLCLSLKPDQGKEEWRCLATALSLVR